MIQAVAQKTEREYRAIPVDSASTLKEFAISPYKYYKRYVLGEKLEDEEESRATLIGSIVHCLLLEPHVFDEKFYVSTCEDKPTEKMLEFVNALYKHTLLATDEDGNVTKDFSFIAMDAYNDSGFKWKFETVIEKFSGVSEDYYAELLATRPRNISVVSGADQRIAEQICNALKNDEFLYEIMNQEDTEDITVLNEVKLEGPKFIIFGLLLKGMVDKMILNHKIKKISIYDLKITWDNENFFEGYYLKRRSYIQAFIYWQLVQIWAEENGYEDYEIEYPKFIVADSQNFYKPLTYVLNSEDIKGAVEGFNYKGKFYKGTLDIITDLKWAIEKNEWQMTRENFLARGIVSFKLK